PVEREAARLGIPVLTPKNFKAPEALAEFAAFNADAAVVVAYGIILPKAVLEAPRLGCFNVHASLLPRWRGAAPIQRALLAGDAETGVCLMQMEAGLDTGPVLHRAVTPIDDADTSGTLHDRLAALGADLLALGLSQLARGDLPRAEPQPDPGTTYAAKLDKVEAKLDLDRPATELARAVRALQPWPVAEIELGGERLRVHAAQALSNAANAAPGALVALGAAGLDVATGNGVLRITRLQRDGGRVISAADYANACRQNARGHA
ncbi:MAG: methionyl-tRNA formyltransferase, partial [Lysobacterales bacterium]